MSVLSFPTGLAPNSIEWSIKYNSQAFTSQLTGAVQTAVLPGDKWEAVLTFSNKMGETARKLKAFLTSLNGVTGRFYLTPYDQKEVYGVATGTPLVKGASQTGKQLIIDGCTPNITGWLLAGDYFQVGNELKMITQDCNTDANGETTLVFSPALRTAPADNASIITSNPKCIMMLSDDNQTRWNAQIGSSSEKIYAITLNCIEAIDI